MFYIIDFTETTENIGTTENDDEANNPGYSQSSDNRKKILSAKNFRKYILLTVTYN